MEQRFTFDQIASVYRAARPDYPEALVDDVLSYAGVKPEDKILEIGCGTGQATKSFARRGFRILATDPGPEMRRGARETLAGFGNVEFLETTFEACPASQDAVRLIIAAQSWHWVSPEVRFAKAAKMLTPNGSLAVCGHVPVGLSALFSRPSRKSTCATSANGVPRRRPGICRSVHSRDGSTGQGCSGRCSTKAIRGYGSTRHRATRICSARDRITG